MAGLVGQLASAPLGAKGGRSCPAGCPGMQGSLGLLLRLCGLCCVFLTGPRGPSCLDLPVYTSVCLSLELSVNLGLVSLLRACLDLPFCPSDCLLGVWGPLSAWPLAHSAGWARPHRHVHALLCGPGSAGPLPSPSPPGSLTLQTSLRGPPEPPASPRGAQVPPPLTLRLPDPLSLPTKAPSVSSSHTFLEEGKSAQIPASLWQGLSATLETCTPQNSSLRVPRNLGCNAAPGPRGLAERAGPLHAAGPVTGVPVDSLSSRRTWASGERCLRNQRRCGGCRQNVTFA